MAFERLGEEWWLFEANVTEEEIALEASEFVAFKGKRVSFGWFIIWSQFVSCFMAWVFDEETVTRFAVDGTDVMDDNDDGEGDVDVDDDEDGVVCVVGVEGEVDSLDGTALFANVTVADVSGELGCDVSCCFLTRVFRRANIASWLAYEKERREGEVKTVQLGGWYITCKRHE